ncbi:MAG TPA: TolC family protein [Methylotenera sp.]
MLNRYFILTLLSGLMIAPQAMAAGSVWYTDGDPLSTSLELPPPVYGVGFKPEIAGQSCADIDFTKALTLAEVTEAALCNNPQTRETYANAKVQAAQLGIAKSAFLPTLTDSFGINQNFVNPESASRGRDYTNLSNSLAASYLLYDFGNRDAALENARQLLNAVSATQSAVVQNILLSTVKAYYQVQSDIALLEATKEAERFNLESFKSAEAKYKAGVSTPADKLQAETAYAQAMLNRISAEGALKTDYGILANVMGMNANVPLNLVPSVNSPVNTSEIERDINQLIEYARVRRPDLVASEAQVSAAKASILASRAAAKPTVSVGVSNSFQDGSSLSSTNSSTLGLTVTVPIFSGYAPSYRIRAAEATAEAREAQRDQLKLQISLDVWTAFQNLRTAHETIKSAEVLVNSATESARVALGRYKAGVGNIIDTLNAQSALASANQQKIKADLNRNTARAALAQAIGTLDSVMIQSLPDGGTAVTEANF